MYQEEILTLYNNNNLPAKIDNLLNEGIDQENYHIFVKGILYS